MPFKPYREEDTSSEGEAENQVAVMDLFPQLFLYTDDGGDGEFRIERILAKTQEDQSWLLVVSVTLSTDAKSVVQTSRSDTTAYVCYVGASSLSRAFVKLEGGLKDGTLDLYPDKFASTRQPTSGTSSKRGKGKSS